MKANVKTKQWQLSNKYSNHDDDDELMLNVLRCQLIYLGQIVTNAEARCNKSLRPRKPEGSLGLTARTSTSTLKQLLNYAPMSVLEKTQANKTSRT